MNKVHFLFDKKCTLRRRCNLTPACNVCKAWGPTKSTINQKCISNNFLSTWLADQQWLFTEANNGAYSNPARCKYSGGQNEDLGIG